MFFDAADATPASGWVHRSPCPSSADALNSIPDEPRVLLAYVLAQWFVNITDLPPINHLQSVRITLLTIGEIHEDPKTAVHLRI